MTFLDSLDMDIRGVVRNFIKWRFIFFPETFLTFKKCLKNITLI